jgi:hypothetical protein
MNSWWKHRPHPRVDQGVELKPFCYYCDREFDSAKTLIQHQRTKHFCCGDYSVGRAKT